MRLTDYTDYTLRVLMFCALNPYRSVTIAELAESHAISKNHLMKIVNDLANQGVLLTTRGRGGGLKLQKNPADICIGDVVRASETDFRMVECFDAAHNSCTLTAQCRLKFVFKRALESYLAELDKVTLADITSPLPVTSNPSEDTVTRVPLSALRKSVPPTTPPIGIEILI
jgi:Rrf2 family nitric oxide-sensitive transcriptional repressor